MALAESQSRLWARLQSFPLDVAGHPVPFTERLRLEQAWPRDFTLRVVFEYRRFLLLAATADGVMVPSDAVDQAWHQHMLDTRAYWDDFCGEIIGQPIHHTPTRGGEAERGRHEDGYDATLDRYRAAFGEEPPRDIWPPASDRFAGRYRRVDLRNAWVIPKKPALGAAIGGLAAFTLTGCAEILFSSSLVAGSLLLGVLVVAITAIAWRPPRRERATNDGTGCGGAMGGCSCPGSGDAGSGCGSGCGGGCGGS